MLSINRNIRINTRGAVIPVLALAAILFAFLMPPWDRGVIDSGVYIYAQNYLADSHQGHPVEKMHMHDKKLLYYKEGVYATVSVLKGKYLFLRISGKTDAGTSPDMMTQHLVSHLPLLFHKDPKTALVIGLASGTSLGSALQYPLKEVDCVEISPEVVEASKFFREANHNALDDPRVKLHIVDGRNFVMAINKKYDVIISEPSNPWISGVSNLFTQDFYKLCAEKLKDDGLMCQWFQFYRMSPENLNIAMNTFLSVFPSITIWSPTIGEMPLGDILMVGSKKKNFKIDIALLNEKFKNKKIKEDLALIDINEPFDVLSCFLIGEENVYRSAYKTPLNTDDYPVIEFQAPKTLYREAGMTILDYIREHTGCGFPPLDNYGKGAKAMLTLHYKLGLAYSFRGKHLMAIEEFDDCLEIEPDFSVAKYLLSMSLHHLGRHKEAACYWREIMEASPDSKEAKLAKEQLKEHGL
jgi:spermidine synthase